MSRHFLMALGALVVWLFALAYPAQAQPPALPFSPYGTVRVNNANVLDGIVVSAWCGGVAYRQTSTATANGESWYFNLDIPGDDPETPGVKEGCTPNETVSFQIGDLSANQTTPWISGSAPRLDLAATGGASPTPTATPTETRPPTNTPTATATNTSTSTRTPTGTPAPTATSSSTPTRTASPAAMVTKTPTPKPTQTAKPTRTPWRRATPVQAAIEGYTWEDKDHNGYPDEMEGIPGAEVILRPAAGQQAGPNEEHVAVSDVGGHYLFEDVAPGTYTAQVRAPKGYRAADEAPVNIVVIVHQTEQVDFEFYLSTMLYLPLVMRS